MIAAPPGLVAAGLLLWGWRSGHLGVALALACLVEGRHHLASRWSLEDADFNRVADLCTVLFLALSAYQFTAARVDGVYAVLDWMPAVIAPLLLAQVYSSAGTVPAGALFASLRRAPPGARLRRLDLSLAYVMMCLVAATPGTAQRPIFLGASLALVAWALAAQRPRRYRIYTWAVAVAAMGLLGWQLGNGAILLQRQVESTVADWIGDGVWMSRNADATWTAIGSLARVKLSDRIDLRVTSTAPLRDTLLLREAAYAAYAFGSWRNSERRFQLIDRAPGTARWDLAPGAPTATVSITLNLRQDSAILPLPIATLSVASADITALQRSAMGTVSVDARSGFLVYRALSGDSRNPDPPPGPELLAVPDSLATPLEASASAAGARVGPPAARIRAIAAWFAGNFSYTLDPRQGVFGRSLAAFLTRDRTGHCEYFATATVLLLRTVGIPARYAVGYAVEEYSPLEQAYVARARHRHAWAEAYVDGHWQVVDTTPAAWFEEDAARAASPLSLVQDLVAFLRLRLAGFGADERYNTLLLLAVVPLAAILLWRLRGRTRVDRRPRAAALRPAPAGADSPLYRLAAWLEADGSPAATGETLRAWYRRALRERAVAAAAAPLLDEALALHEQERFAGVGLAADARARLGQLTERLLEFLRARH